MVKCRYCACGKPVTTHSMAIFAAIPAFARGFVCLQSSSLLMGAAVVGGVLTMALVQTFVVHLARSGS